MEMGFQVESTPEITEIAHLNCFFFLFFFLHGQLCHQAKFFDFYHTKISVDNSGM